MRKTADCVTLTMDDNGDYGMCTSDSKQEKVQRQHVEALIGDSRVVCVDIRALLLQHSMACISV